MTSTTSQLDTTRISSYLSFKLNEEQFAIPVSDILEILEVPQLTKVPNAPLAMKGVVNFRNSALPIIDIKEKFGIGTIEFTVNTCILVLNLKENNKTISAGILVDAVMEVFDIDADNIQSTINVGNQQQENYINGMLRAGDKFAMLLDVSKIFSTTDIGKIAEKSKTTIEA